MTDTLLRPFLSEDIGAAVSLSKAAGWAHGAEDWAALLPMSLGFVALSGAEVVGTILRSDFGPRLSHINMVIVREDQRGRGLGQRLVQSVLTSGRVHRLTATAQGRPLYEKLGFRETGLLGKYMGVVREPEGSAPQVASAKPNDLGQILAMETADYGGERSALVTLLQEVSEMAVIRDRSGKITSYAAVRPFANMHVLGPISAPDLASAKALVCYFAARHVGKTLRVDTYAKLGLGLYLEQLGICFQETCPMMQLGTLEQPNPRFAIFSQAVG